MSRTQKKRLIIAGILIALPVLVLVEEHFRGKWALAKLKRQLVAKGEKLTINDCRPPAPQSAAENGYFELLRAAEMLGGNSLNLAAPRSLNAIAPGKVEVVYNRAEWKVSDSTRATNNNWKTLEDSFSAWREPLDGVRTAIRRQEFDSGLDYTLGFDIALPHLARFKSATQHLGIDALIHLHHGRLDEAIDDIEAQLLLSHHMRNERLLISQLVRIGITASAIGPTWQVLQAPGLTDARLERLQRAWETSEFTVSLNQSLEMERAMGVAMFTRLRRSVDEAARNLGVMGMNAPGRPVQSVEDLVDRIGGSSGQLVMKGIYIPLWQFAWSHQDECSYLETMQEVLEGSRESARRYSVAPSSAVANQLDERSKNQSSYGRVRRHVSEMLAGSMSRAYQRAASIEAQRALTVTAIALKRYELRHGSTAASLPALVPEFLREVPRDIFDGQPLRYRSGGNGNYLLYSIGKDERDDGGDPARPDKVPRNLHITNGRDWVWPMPATEQEIRAAEEKERQRK